VLNSYVSLTEGYFEDIGYISSKFDMNDPSVGVKRIAIFKSMREMVQNKEGVDYLIGKLGEHAKKLSGYISKSESVKNILVARSIADIMTLGGFLTDYKDEIDRKIKGCKNAVEVRDEIGKFYYTKKEELAIIMPDIYEHRIQKTLGI